MSRIVVFGATGYTGRLVSEELVAAGLRPVLAGRSAKRLDSLAAELGGLETAVADVAQPTSCSALVERGDVLVATVGPFMRFGQPAVEAAIAAGANYIDSTGEPPFIREVFEHYGKAAERADCALMTAMGYDWVPGNLAGALALERAGGGVVRVDTGYFSTGDGQIGMSGGTRASLAGAVVAPSYAWRDGRIVTERGAKRVRTFDIAGKERAAVSVGASDHFGLPRLAPGLREVNAYLGWFGPLSRPMQVGSAVGAAFMALPGARGLTEALTARLVKGSTGGPDEEERAKSGSHVVAIAYDEAGQVLSEVHLSGVNGYTFTGAIIAWAAGRAAEGGVTGAGALAPVEAFGIRELQAGCAQAGLLEAGAAAATAKSVA